MTPEASALYSDPATASRTARDTEYDIIARITRQLASANGQRHTDFPGFLEALFRNERLWSTLAADVAEVGNGLPQALRARLFYLYQFTIEHGRKIRAGEADAGVLIDINKAVLRGLRGERAS